MLTLMAETARMLNEILSKVLARMQADPPPLGIGVGLGPDPRCHRGIGRRFRGSETACGASELVAKKSVDISLSDAQGPTESKRLRIRGALR